MYFEIVGPIADMETIAAGRSIRQLSRLRRQYGQGRWRKLKGIATVRIASGQGSFPRAGKLGKSLFFSHCCVKKSSSRWGFFAEGGSDEDKVVHNSRRCIGGGTRGWSASDAGARQGAHQARRSLSHDGALRG